MTDNATLLAFVARWSPEWQYHFEERAAIIEYDSRMSRDMAERAAYDQVLQQRAEAKKQMETTT